MPDFMDYPYTIAVVCNYDPAGNMEGANMYDQGYPCEECDNGCWRDALCL